MAGPCGFSAFLCTCIPGDEPHTLSEARAALAGREVLFSGLVLSTSYGRDPVRVQNTQGDSVWWRSPLLVATMIPEEIWKGKLADTVRVETEAQTTACGASLVRGYRYLIDASRSGESIFSTDKCHWTRHPHARFHRATKAGAVRIRQSPHDPHRLSVVAEPAGTGAALRLKPLSGRNCNRDLPC